MKRIFLWFLLSFVACNKKAAEPLQSEGYPIVCPNGNAATTPAEGYRLILGTWDWAQDVWSRRGSGTSIDTPASTGKRFGFVFNADRTYRYLENGAVLETGTYALRQFGTDPILVLDLTPSGKFAAGGVLLTLCENGLVLLGGANDAGANRYFVRGQ